MDSVLAYIRKMPVWQIIAGCLMVCLVVVLIVSGIRSCTLHPEAMPAGDVTATPVDAADIKVSSYTATPSPTASVTPTPTSRPTSTPRPTFTPSPTPMITILGIRELGRLEATRYMMRDIVEVHDAPENFIEQLSKDKLVLIAEGEVVAGFDLSKIDEYDVHVYRDSVLLVLPPAEILYTRVDNENTYVFERETGLFRRPDPHLETEARRIAERHLGSWALERGILQEAETDGIRFLESILQSLGFTKIRLEIKDQE